MPALKNYSPKEVIVSWKGRELNNGIAPVAGAISVARAGPLFTLNVSGDGRNATRIRNMDQQGTVTIQIVKGSNTVDFLTEQLRGEELEPPIPAVGALSVEDLLGNTLHSCENAFLQGFPQDDMGAGEESVLEYVLLCPALDMNSGSSLQVG